VRPQESHARDERVLMEARYRIRRDGAEFLVNLNTRVPTHTWRRVRFRCLAPSCAASPSRRCGAPGARA